jgi:DNA helicase IV
VPVIDERRFSPRALAALGPDIAHLDKAAALVAEQLRDLVDRRAELRLQHVPSGAPRLQRDLEIEALSRRIHTLSRLGSDLCLGRFDRRDGSRVYVGRLGLRDSAGVTVLVDWRTPEAEPFFAATLKRPLGVVRRRRFRWASGVVVDSWDEWLDLGAEQEDSGLQDAQSAFLASLAARRTGRMTSALATLQADQDEIVRADGRGCVVVDGGPGTGKTVVALHRAAYLAFTSQDAVLYVTKHARLATYVRDVLPSLGEEDVPVVSLDELYADRATRRDPQPELSRLKGDRRMVDAVERAVAFFEDLPQETVVVELPDREVVVRPSHWVEALTTCGETQHIPRRTELLVAVGELLAAPELARHPALVGALRRSWPDLSPAGVVADLLTHRGLLAHCAPWLTAEQRAAIRADALAHEGWHLSDLPLLDVARQRLGLEPIAEVTAAELTQRRAAAQATVEELARAAGDGSALHLLTQTHPDHVQPADVLEPESAPAARTLGQRTFTHVVVDEAQDLTGVEWAVLRWRCPSRSFTVVGDRAQSRAPFHESWQERMAAAGLPQARVLRLSINYRTPIALMTPAAAVISAARPDVLVPEAIRPGGRPMLLERTDDGAGLVATAVAQAIELLGGQGTAGVVLHPDRTRPTAPEGITFYTPEDLQGLEMDVVVIVEPAELWPQSDSASSASLYVALTRATQSVVVLHSRELPECALPLMRHAVAVG